MNQVKHSLRHTTITGNRTTVTTILYTSVYTSYTILALYNCVDNKDRWKWKIYKNKNIWNQSGSPLHVQITKRKFRSGINHLVLRLLAKLSNKRAISATLEEGGYLQSRNRIQMNCTSLTEWKNKQFENETSFIGCT